MKSWAVRMAFLVGLAISASQWQGVLAAGVPQSSGIYTFELCGGRTKCSKKPEFLGFNNKTCNDGVPPKSQFYGDTVGPVLRGTNGESRLWRWWNVKVTSSVAGATYATLKNAFPSKKGKPRCLGYYMTDYYRYRNKKACKELPWATRVHLHKESHPWRLVPVTNTDCFNIVDDGKPSGCLRYLSASASCGEKYLRLTAGDDGSGLQRWRMVSYGGSPSPIPKPPAPKPPVPVKYPPPQKAPLPPPPLVVKSTPPLLLSVGASSTTTGSVVFEPSPGAISCTVYISKSGQPTVASTISSLAYPQTTFYPVNLSPDSDYGVELKCKLPGDKVLTAPATKKLHTPHNNGQPTVLNFFPTSDTSGNLTVVRPDPAFCNAKSYIVKVLPRSGNGVLKTINSTSTTISVTGLTPGVAYAIVIQAVCDDGRVTDPLDPIYLTPPKSSASQFPPPAKSPSPPPAKSPSPGSPGVVSPPPSLTTCDENPVLNVVAVSGSLVTVQVAAPAPIKGSEVAVAVACKYNDGTEGGFDTGGWIPASDPVTSIQVHIDRPGKCEVLVAVQQQLSLGVPVLCPVEDGSFELKATEIIPGIQNVQAKSSEISLQLVAPKIGCVDMSYIIRARPFDPLGHAIISTVTTSAATVNGLTPGAQYNVTVSGKCRSDGSETPESPAIKTTIPCDSVKNYNPNPVDGKCTCKSGYQLVNGSCVESQPCPAGQYRDSVANTCTQCSPLVSCTNVFCSSSVDSKCSVCKTGYKIDANTGQCVGSCGPGQFLDAQSNACAPCKPVAGCTFGYVVCSGASNSTCNLCDTSKNYAPAPLNGKCVCQVGYQITNGACVETTPCLSGQYRDPKSNSCAPCTPVKDCEAGSTTCTSSMDSKCTKCKTGLYDNISGGCTSCIVPAGCATAGITCTSSLDSDTKCSGCGAGFYLDKGRCIYCNPIPGCDKSSCSSSGSACSSCNAQSNFNPTPVDGSCKCAEGYFFSSSACFACKAMTGCAGQITCSSLSTSTCSQCSSGYTNSTGGQCTLIPSPPPSPPPPPPTPVPSGPQSLAPPTGGFAPGCFYTELSITGCSAYESCPGGGKRCTGCDTDPSKHVASATPNSNGQCPSVEGWADLDGNPDNGYETSIQPLPKVPLPPINTATFAATAAPNPDVPPVFFAKCYYGSGCPGSHTKENPDMRTCSSPGEGWTPFTLKTGTYAIDRTKYDISSLIVTKGYKVTLYIGGQLSGNNVVDGPNNPATAYEVTCDSTGKDCLNSVSLMRTLTSTSPGPYQGSQYTFIQSLDNNVDYIKVEYDAARNCPPATSRSCYECDPDAPQLCELLYRPVTCVSPNNYCITFIDNKLDGSKVVSRGCGNYDRCFTDWYQGTSDEDTCRGTFSAIQLLDFTCTFCCVADNCNDNLKPAEDTLFEIK